MSPSKRYNGKISSAAAASTAVVGAVSKTTKAIKLQRNTRGGKGHHHNQLHRQQHHHATAVSTLSKSSLPLPSSSSSRLTAAAVLLTSNIDTSSLLEEQQQQTLRPRNTRATAAAAAATEASVVAANEIASLGSLKDNDNKNNTNDYDNNNNNNREYTSSTTPSFKIMSYQSIFALLAVLVCGLVSVNGLKCHMCGQYNEGVGSITPCLNYSDQYAHLYLKECSKKSEKYCVKYVSELSTVRDCATECAEKEIWETQTYCCTEDGCNGSSAMEFSSLVLIVPLIAYICQAIWNVIKERR